MILSPRPSPHAEIWLTSPDDETLCILTDGKSAWLLYMEEEDDPGFSAINPGYDGPEDAMITYVLASGQRDEYPASSAVTFSEAVRAAEHFVETFEPAPFLTWDLE